MPVPAKTIRPTAGVRALCVAIYLAGTTLLAFRVPERFRMFVVIGYAVIGALWLADLFLVRIELRADDILIFANFKSRTIPRSEIESVTWEKGGGAALKLRNGKWVNLPSAGQLPSSLTNTIRAWLKKTEAN